MKATASPSKRAPNWPLAFGVAPLKRGAPQGHQFEPWFDYVLRRLCRGMACLEATVYGHLSRLVGCEADEHHLSIAEPCTPAFARNSMFSLTYPRKPDQSGSLGVVVLLGSS